MNQLGLASAQSGLLLCNHVSVPHHVARTPFGTSVYVLLPVIECTEEKDFGDGLLELANYLDKGLVQFDCPQLPNQHHVRFVGQLGISHQYRTFIRLAILYHHLPWIDAAIFAREST